MKEVETKSGREDEVEHAGRGKRGGLVLQESE